MSTLQPMGEPLSYADFLSRKQPRLTARGPRIDLSDVHPMLHSWQAEIVRWAVHTGRAAVWADTGLGKTVMQLEWARLSGNTALIVAPLAVCQQTVREAARIGIDVHYVRNGANLTGPGVWITNYEMVPHFDPSILDSVVLDESSILKNADGKTRGMLIRHFAGVRARLSCTATPAPNDPEELTSQAEFLGHATRTGMLATYFVHDSDGWRLKGHARGPMFRWLAEWALAIRRPSDLGSDDTGYVLPGLEIYPQIVPVEIEAEGQLFATDLGGVAVRPRTPAPASARHREDDGDVQAVQAASAAAGGGLMNFICGGGRKAPTDSGLWPDTGLDEPCCESSAYDGPGSCTCWKPIYNTTQQPIDETAVNLLDAGVTPTVRPSMCGDCAYRPGSPEKSGDPTYNGSADFLEGLAERGERFWCHDGNLIAVKWRHPKTGMEIPGHPGAYCPPTVKAVPYKVDGSPSYLCAGWDARRRALNAANADTPP